MATDEYATQFIGGTDTDAVPPITPKLYTPVEGDWIGKAREKALPRASWIQTYRAYYLGHQPNGLTAEQKEILKGLFESGFCDNVTKQVIDINVGRVEFEGWAVGIPPHNPDNTAEVEKAEKDAKDVLDTLGDFHVRAGIDALQTKTARAAMRDGNAYWGIAWDKASKRAVPTLKLAWDGYEGMWLAYDQDGLPEYAVYEWMEYEAPKEYRGALGVLKRFVTNLLGTTEKEDELVRYRTIYLANKIIYMRLDPKNSRWEEFQRPYPNPVTGIMEMKSVVPHVRGIDDPLGIPVIHFPNRGGEGKYGVSELDGGFIGGQDNVNDSQYNVGAIGRYSAFPRVCISGVIITDPTGKPILDDNGDPISENLRGSSSPAGLTLLSNPNGKMTHIPAGDSEPILNILNSQISTLCRNTSTPEYLIRSTTPPSGEAIIQLSAGLVNKAKEQVNLFAPAYASAAHMVTVLLNTYAQKNLNTDALIKAVFAPTDRRDPLSLADYVAKLGKDVSHAERLRQLGYNTQDIARITGELEAETTTVAERDLLLYETLTAADTAMISPEFALERMGFDADTITKAMADREKTQAARVSDIGAQEVVQ